MAAYPRSPCARYLLGLFLQGWSVQRIEAHARCHKLDFHSTQYLIYLQETSLPPEIFRPRDPHHTPSQDYLASLGLQGEVPSWSSHASAALVLLKSKKAREILELAALGGLPQQELLSLLRSHKFTPSLAILQKFYSLFFDLDGLDRVEVHQFLLHREPNTQAIKSMMAANEAAAAGGAPQLPFPTEPLFDVHVERTNPPGTSVRAAARNRRSRMNNDDLVSLLERTKPLDQRLREAELQKLAGYTDPRRILASLPPSPLTVFLTHAYLGQPLLRQDLKKAYDVLLTLGTLRATELLVSSRPDAPVRLRDLTSALRTLQTIQQDFGAGAESLQKQVQAIAIRTEVNTHRGDLAQRTGGEHHVNPYMQDVAEMQQNASVSSKPSISSPREPARLTATQAPSREEEE